MKDYKVVEAGDLPTLTQSVNDQISKGWVPQGGVASFVTHERDGYGNNTVYTWFIQAMMKL
jgi:hypothetical protein